MAKYSMSSERRLLTATPDMQAVFRCAIAHGWDHTIIEAHRGEAEQNAARRAGRSTKSWPNSKHNQLPSPAVDAAPYYPEAPNGGIDWRTDKALLDAARLGDWAAVVAILENIKRWMAFGGFIRGIGAAKGIRIRHGGDWDGDQRFNDHHLVDLPHFEEVTDGTR